MDYKFTKALHRTEDLLEVIPIPRSSLFKFRDDWIAKGGNPSDMGLVKLEGSDLNYWNGPKFLEWLYRHKVINTDVKILVSKKGTSYAKA